MGLYIAIPKNSHALVEVATSAALKTVLQVATPSTTDLVIVGWGISFDGTAVTDAPGQVTLIDTNVTAVTLTSLTPEKWGNDDNPNSLCVGGASATGYNPSGGEGTITDSRILDGQNVHPQHGYSMWFPELERPKVQLSRFLRIRCNFGTTVNCIPWIVWKEPS